MATNLLGADVAGSSMTTSINDFRRDKASRKLLYHHDGNKKALIDYITASGTTTAERYADDGSQSAAGTLVHPEKLDLPLQTVAVTKIGQDRWSATLQYFRIPTGGWGGSNSQAILQMRTSLQPMRIYTDGKPFSGGGGGTGTGPPEYDHFWNYAIPGGDILIPSTTSSGADGPRKISTTSPNSYSRVYLCPEIKLQIPFATTSNPFTNAGFVGGLNSGRICFGQNLCFNEEQVRFDGVQMTDQGSYVTSGGVTARYVGTYEFTATPTQFYVQVPVWSGALWNIELNRDGVNPYGSWNNFSTLGL
jgi:hypothetical protein